MNTACKFITILWVGATILSFIIKKNGLQTKNTDKLGERQEAGGDAYAQDSLRWLARGTKRTDTLRLYPQRDGVKTMSEVVNTKRCSQTLPQSDTME
jgi:hypothetical protein